MHPLKAQYLCTVKKAQKTVALTWMIAIILAYPVTMVQVGNLQKENHNIKNIARVVYDNVSHNYVYVQVHVDVGFKYCGFWCVRDWKNPIWWMAHEIYFLVVILLIPTSIMSFAYGRIIIEICRVFEERRKMARESMEASTRKMSTQLSSHKKHSVGSKRKRSEHDCKV